MENEGGGARETVAGVPEVVDRGDFGAVDGELGKPTEKKLERPVEMAAGAGPVVLPQVSLATDGPSDDVGAQDGTAPDVDRDAERMPKEYARHLVEIMRRYKREPNKLQSSVTSLKWDYMSKAFGRKLGDGLDGRAGN